jgi:hypothetical protein
MQGFLGSWFTFCFACELSSNATEIASVVLTTCRDNPCWDSTEQRNQEKGLHILATRVPDLSRSPPAVPIHRLLKEVLNTIVNHNCPPSKLSLALVALDWPKVKVSKTPTSYPYIKPVLLLALTSTSYRPLWKFIHPPSNRPNQATSTCLCTVDVVPPPILPLSKRYSKRNARSPRNEPVGTCLQPALLQRLPLHYSLSTGALPETIRLATLGVDRRGWSPLHVATVWGVRSMCFDKSIQRI